MFFARIPAFSVAAIALVSAACVPSGGPIGTLDRSASGDAGRSLSNNNNPNADLEDPIDDGLGENEEQERPVVDAGRRDAANTSRDALPLGGEEEEEEELGDGGAGGEEEEELDDAGAPRGDAGVRDGGGPGDVGPAGDGGLLAFGAACTQNAQCADGICGTFGQTGQLCTKACQVNADCPAGSQGQRCNTQNLCRP